MTGRWVKAPKILLGAVFLVALLALACAKAEEKAAPAPAPAPAPAVVPAPALVPAPTAVAAPAPAPVPAPPSGAAGAEARPAPSLEAQVRVDPRSIEPGSLLVQEFTKYHHSRLPLWEKAKYGGERVGHGTFSPAFYNPLKQVQLSRPVLFGMLFTVDVGTCSLIGRTDFSRCHGVRTNNQAGEVVNMVIEKWEQPDPLTLVFYVRRGVLWPAVPPMTRPDRSVTAEDIRWYMETQKKEGVHRSAFELVDKVDVIDRYTLKLSFSKPDADFLRKMGSTSLGIVPKECYDEKGCLDSPKMISPGPFRLDTTDFDPRSKFIYLKNEEFYLKGLPYLDRIVMINVPDPAAQRSAFIVGKRDHFSTYIASERDALIKQTPQARIQFQISPVGSWNMQMRMDKPPWNDERVRMAISNAINRPKAWQAGAEGAALMTVPMLYDYLGLEIPVNLATAGKHAQYNPEESKRLLKEAGYEKGFTFSWWVTGANALGKGNVGLSVKEDLAKIGVNAEIKEVDGVTHTTQWTGKNWEGVIFNQCYFCGISDADSFVNVAISTSALNYMGINDPKIDELYVKQRSELDAKKRQDLLWDYTRYMLDHAYGIHIGSVQTYEHYQPWLVNMAATVYCWSSATNVPAWVVWVDPDQGFKSQ